MVKSKVTLKVATIQILITLSLSWPLQTALGEAGSAARQFIWSEKRVSDFSVLLERAQKAQVPLSLLERAWVSWQKREPEVRFSNFFTGVQLIRHWQTRAQIEKRELSEREKTRIELYDQIHLLANQFWSAHFFYRLGMDELRTLESRSDWGQGGDPVWQALSPSLMNNRWPANTAKLRWQPKNGQKRNYELWTFTHIFEERAKVYLLNQMTPEDELIAIDERYLSRRREWDLKQSLAGSMKAIQWNQSFSQVIENAWTQPEEILDWLDHIPQFKTKGLRQRVQKTAITLDSFSQLDACAINEESLPKDSADLTIGSFDPRDWTRELEKHVSTPVGLTLPQFVQRSYEQMIRNTLIAYLSLEYLLDTGNPGHLAKVQSELMNRLCPAVSGDFRRSSEICSEGLRADIDILTDEFFRQRRVSPTEMAQLGPGDPRIRMSYSKAVDIIKEMLGTEKDFRSSRPTIELKMSLLRSRLSSMPSAVKNDLIRRSFQYFQSERKDLLGMGQIYGRIESALDPESDKQKACFLPDREDYRQLREANRVLAARSRSGVGVLLRTPVFTRNGLGPRPEIYFEAKNSCQMTRPNVNRITNSLVAQARDQVVRDYFTGLDQLRQAMGYQLKPATLSRPVSMYSRMGTSPLPADQMLERLIDLDPIAVGQVLGEYPALAPKLCPIVARLEKGKLRNHKKWMRSLWVSPGAIIRGQSDQALFFDEPKRVSQWMVLGMSQVMNQQLHLEQKMGDSKDSASERVAVDYLGLSLPRLRQQGPITIQDDLIAQIGAYPIGEDSTRHLKNRYQEIFFKLNELNRQIVQHYPPDAGARWHPLHFAKVVHGGVRARFYILSERLEEAQARRADANAARLLERAAIDGALDALQNYVSGLEYWIESRGGAAQFAMDWKTWMQNAYYESPAGRLDLAEILMAVGKNRFRPSQAQEVLALHDALTIASQQVDGKRLWESFQAFHRGAKKCNADAMGRVLAQILFENQNFASGRSSFYLSQVCLE